MDHIVYPYCPDAELNNLSTGNNPMIIRGSDTICHPYGVIKKGDTLYFVDRKVDNEISYCGTVSSVINSDKLTKEESIELVITYQERLQLPDDQFYKVAGCKYLILIGIENYRQIVPFRFHYKSITGNECWITLENIKNIVASQEENFFSGIIAV